MRTTTASLAMTGDADTIDRYERAMDRLLRFHPDAVDLATELVGVPDPVPMAHALIAYLHLMSTDAADLATAQLAHDALVVAGGNERERAHAAAIGRWLAGDWGGAARELDELLVRWPTDLLALMFGHQLDFFIGDAGVAARPADPLAAGDRPAAPARPVRARHGRVRAGGGRALRRGAGRRAGRRRGQPRRRVGRPRRRAHLRDAGPHRRGHRLPALGRAPPGRPGTCSRCTTGGTSRCTSWRPAAPSARSRSTTPRSTTSCRSACRSRCSTPAPCCGGCCSTAPTPAAASPRSPTPGRRRRPARRGTRSTTSTPRWRSPVPAGSATPTS